MERPRVQLKSTNIVKELRSALDNSLHRFLEMEGVVGIILDGGLSRGYGDILSEIDVVIYLHEKAFDWYKNGNCPVALGITVIDGYLYDIKLVNYEDELERSYDSTALWDLSYADILYDPEGKIAEFKSRKLACTVDIDSAGGLLWEAYWNYRLAGDIWIYRQDTMQGHYVFNNAIKPLVSALFIVNREYIPHDKWLIHMSRSLAWKPDSWEKDLQGALNTGDFSVRSLEERQMCIDRLWNGMNDRLCEMTGTDDRLNFVRKAGYESLKKLIEKEEYTLQEWAAMEGLEALNYEPLHSVFHREGDRILLDKERLISIRPEDMYVWFYEIVDAGRKGVAAE